MTIEKHLENVNKRVARGVRYLDKFLPGWRKNIELDTLKIQSSYDCLISQLLGDYHKWAGVVGYKFSLTKGLTGLREREDGYSYKEYCRYMKKLNKMWAVVLGHDE